MSITLDLARNLRTDMVAVLKPTAGLVVRADCSICEAVQFMRRQQAGCVLVCNGKQLVGIFTERDLLTRVLAESRSFDEPIADVMTPNPVTVTLRDPIRRAVVRMEKGGYRHLPVLDDTGRPTGVLSVKKLVHYIAEHFPTTVFNLPPGPEPYPQRRAGA